MSGIACPMEIEETFCDYREKIAVAEIELQCCESRLPILPGETYVLCEGATTSKEIADGWGPCIEGETDEGAGYWVQYPQHVEVWRFARTLRKKHEFCAPFSCLSECAEEALDEDDEPIWWVWARWKGVVAGIRKRQAEGLGPWLYSFELAATGDKIPFDAWGAKP